MPARRRRGHRAAAGSPQLVERETYSDDVHRRQLGAHELDLGLRSRPLATHLQQLRPVDPADAEEHHRVAEAGTPTRRGVRPLLGPPDVGELVADGHQLAVDVADERRPHPPCHDRQHRFVEHRQPMSDIALLDAGDAFADQRVGAQRLVAETLGERGERSGNGDGGLEVTFGGRRLELERSEVAVFGTLGEPVEQSVGTTQPTRTHRLLTA